MSITSMIKSWKWTWKEMQDWIDSLTPAEQEKIYYETGFAPQETVRLREIWEAEAKAEAK